MPFNPDKYLEDKQTGFNPDAYLAAKAQPVPQLPQLPEVSQLESGLRGLGQGASLGFADEIAGGLGAAGQAAQKMSLSDLVKDYMVNRDKYRAADKAAQTANPKTFMAGEIGGGIGTMFVPGLGLAKGAGTLAKIGSAAAMGGLNAIGKSEADNAGDLTKDVALGAGAGLVGLGAGKLLSHAIPTAAGSAALAEQKAVEHLRPTPKIARILGPDRLNDIGREALDSGAIEFGAKSGQTAANLSDLRQEAGQIMGDFIKNSDAKLNPQEIASEFQKKVIEPLNSTAANQGLVQRLKEQAASFVSHYGDSITPEQVELEKRAVNKGINYLTDPKVSQEAQMGWANTLKDASQNAIDNPGFNAAKQSFGKLAEGQAMAERTAGLTDTGKGLIGHMYDIGAGHLGLSALMHGHPATAAATIGGRALLGGRTASALSVGADKASKFLQDNPVANKVMQSLETGVEQGAPAAFRQSDIYTKKQMTPQTINEQLSKNPEAQKFAPAIQAAADQGGQDAVVATHFILSQTEPDYQKAFMGE